MSIAAILLDAPAARGHRHAPEALDLAAIARAASAAGADEVIAVVAEVTRAERFGEGVTVLLDEGSGGACGALRAALDWAARAGHTRIAVARLDERRGLGALLADDATWAAAAGALASPVAVLPASDQSAALVALDASAWPVVPLEGPLEGILARRPELVAPLVPDARRSRAAAAPGDGARSAPSTDPTGEWASPEDVAAVEEALGRRARGRFSVVVRDRVGAPVVIRNAPILEDGTPMPTRYWLVGRQACELVGRLESTGAVDELEALVDPGLLARAHERYAEERARAIPTGHLGPRPAGGVGGTRVGVKCLHAHLAWYLAGGGDPVGGAGAARRAGHREGAVAAIDLGTNSTRLLIAGPGGETLAREMTITRLGAGVDETRRLDDAAIGRTLEALDRYRTQMDAHGVVAVRATATSAARDATNAEAFFAAVESVIGVRPELLSGLEEGRLSYAGATTGLDAARGPYLVVDLGGGSTELVAGGPNGGIAAGVSLDVGCVRVTERYFAHDPPAPDELGAARSAVARLVGDAREAHPELGVPRAMVGVAGTVATLVGLSLGLDAYRRDALHHQRLSRAEVERLAAMLSARSVAERRELPGIEAGRADVIVGGAIVLAEVMTVLDHDELVYSEDDILDGLAASLLARASERTPAEGLPGSKVGSRVESRS